MSTNKDQSRCREKFSGTADVERTVETRAISIGNFERIGVALIMTNTERLALCHQQLHLNEKYSHQLT